MVYRTCQGNLKILHHHQIEVFCHFQKSSIFVQKREIFCDFGHPNGSTVSQTIERRKWIMAVQKYFGVIGKIREKLSMIQRITCFCKQKFMVFGEI
jgi:hypothetical protein